MNPLHPPHRSHGLLSLPVLVAALGYFVDIYDLVLLGMVAGPSLTALGVPAAEIKATVGGLLGWQMIGMLIGGFLWGVLADRFGRMTTLFGSILVYSLATGANGFITEVWQYYLLRVIAGIGLAGELGTGITLVAESLPQRLRPLGSTIVACVGIAGAVAGYFLTDPNLLDWRQSYWLGGGLGLGILLLRLLAHESGMFDRIDAKAPRGSLTMLFTSGPRLLRYCRAVFLGATTWYVVGMFVFLAPAMAEATGVVGKVSSRDAILWCYVGLIAGDMVAGILSWHLQSRRKAIALFLLLGVIMCTVVLTSRGVSADTYLLFAGLLGFTSGFWALFVTVAAEQFGTNLRATVATTAPNVARGLLYPIQWAAFAVPGHYLLMVAGLGVVCFAIAAWSLWTIEETSGKDLEFVEELP